MFNDNNFFSGGGGFYPHEIEQSLRFNDDDSAYLSRTPASAGNRKTWTWSGWVKRGNIQSYTTLFSNYLDGNNQFRLHFDANNKLDFYNQDNGSVTVRLTTSAVFRDTSSWYHVVLKIDTTTGNNAIYVNGVEQDLSVDTYTPNVDTRVNATLDHRLFGWTTSQHFDGYAAEVHFTDGTAYDATAFGEFKNGVWVAKSPSVTYGTNGFYLDFADGGAIGNDVSGNNNDWTATNLASTDVMLDSPTNNFAVINPLGTQYSYVPNGTFSEGNLKLATLTTGTSPFYSSIQIPKIGKYYWEYVYTSSIDASFSGVGAYDGSIVAWYVTPVVDDYYIDGAPTATTDRFATGDVIGVCADVDAGTVQFYKNGVAQTLISYDLTNNDYYALFQDATNLSETILANFGQDSSFAGNKTPQGNTDANGIGDFYYAPPAGYLALCTSNLPEPAIGPNSATTSDEHFNSVLWSGDNTSPRSITGIGFQPDLTWLKPRSAAYNHLLWDGVRGAGANSLYTLFSNLTNAESDSLFSQGNGASLDSDGFTVEAGSSGSLGVNGTGVTYVAWNWKADNTSGVSNTDGTITSTVSANVDAGFSIVSYTGTGATTDQTVGHGLSGHAMTIIKARGSAASGTWRCAHVDLTSNYNLALNTTSAEFDVTASTHGGVGDVSSTSNTFTLKKGAVGTNNVNESGIEYIAYNWQEIEGFSKVFSYTGNGSTDGPFQNLGFRPAWILLKRTDSTSDWIIEDGTRSAYNPTAARLNANGADAEDTYFPVDFLSNGFKIRHAGADHNVSGGQYIGIAFASNPFKYSNAN